MKIAAVAYPCLKPRDSEWIESFRVLYDSAASRIAAHFTLVFPTDLEVGELEHGLATVAASVAPIDFWIEAVEVRTDAGISRVFLIPGDGAAEIASLHDRLTVCALKPDREHTPAFTPHITVGTHAREGDAERHASAMRAQWHDVRGRLREIELVGVDPLGVTAIARYPLGPAGTDQKQPSNGVKADGAP